MTIESVIDMAKTESKHNMGIPKKEVWHQIAEWLEELKTYREIGTPKGFTDAINAYTQEYNMRKELEAKIADLRTEYVDNCNMCTSSDCDKCKIAQFIEDLEKLKE